MAMRIKAPTREEAPPETHATLDNVAQRLGFLPNMHRVMSLSPAALTGWSQLLTALSKTLDVRTRDAIGLAVSEVNGCSYCLSAHSYVASNFGKTSHEEIELNRKGSSEDPKRAAAAHFARQLVLAKGKVTDAEVAAVRAAGYSDAQVIDIITLSAQFLLTNFINNAVDTEKDFPSIDPVKEPLEAV